MKNNRQIGLNGRIFISNCLKRGTVFVFLLMLGGIATAFADILKLTGASGAVMSTFSTTLLLYDFVCSLMLVIVVFYAYFLECGDGVPVLRHKPILIFGCARLGYLILLAYYICYRALYCLCGMSDASPTLCIFYFVYFIFIFLCILANCFIYNILTRNIVRRSYIKSFQALSAVGLVVEVLLPVMYIIARVTMKDIGDEFFTTATCDLIRLCLCPICTTGIWLLFVNGVAQVSDVFNEVDTALRERRYQITYTSPDEESGGKDKSGKGKQAYASAAFLPAPNKGTALPGGTAVPSRKALPASAQRSEASRQARPQTAQNTSAPKPPETTGSHSSPVKKKLPANPQKAAENAVKAGAPAAQSAETAVPAAPVQQAVYPQIVQEFNPYPEAVAPPAAGHVPSAPKTARPKPVQVKQSGGKKPAGTRPAAYPQRPVQGTQRTPRPKNGSQPKSGDKK